ncbi:MAG: 2-isopropylmalate synthase [Terracidiphilus sp.]
MLKDPSTKYKPVADFRLDDRRWPSKTIEKAPAWCSVDLRDGNQALVEPMDGARKLRMFELLTASGFKEIEAGFPAASQTDFDFCRELIERKLIPDDVAVQVLVQAREDLMERTFEAIRGVHKAIVHVYNSTSTLQRRVVFGMDKEAIKQLAVKGARLVHEYALRHPETEWVYEYSPESFTGTEMDYAVEVCEAVMEVWQPAPARPVIINLPATVELSRPNVYADQIEWVSRTIKNRESVVLSVHPHNDRGTAVAAAELALMAGADRVEGTLFGNGERTGNVDIVTLALNLYTQGIHPGLDFSNINDVIECVEFCNRMPVHDRHPYAGLMVFTAFSGSHQDAIKKGFAAQAEGGLWEIPYLPIDPQDLGRSYEAVIRVNSQSGKGGVAFLLERDHGIRLPRRLQIELSRIVQQMSDTRGGEVTSEEIWEAFRAEYIDRHAPYLLRGHRDDSNEDRNMLTARVARDGVDHIFSGEGNGPIEAFIAGFQKKFGIQVRIADYEEHAIGDGADATAICFVEARVGNSTHSVYGVGMHGDIVSASLGAIISAVNRSVQREQVGESAS